jgi:DHA3 family tetracycline resistance protein-like MFS transporter
MTRRPSAPFVYLATAGVGGLLWGMFTTVFSLYLIRDLGLDPLQLVLMGTALEVTYLVFEVPTGVVADVVSRKVSIVIGWAVSGAAMIVLGLVDSFGGAILSQVLWALGITFISGADVAWITDEIGEDAARPLFLRGAQFENAGWLVGIATGIGLATVALWIPIVVAGVGTTAVALLVGLVMPETAFVRPAREDGARLGHPFRDTVTSSVRTVRGHPVMLLVLGVAALHGMSTEAFDRLADLHILQIGLPAFAGLDRILWFGVIEAVSLLLGIAATEYVRRHADLEHVNGAARVLVVIDILLTVVVVVFGLATGFALAVLTCWAATGLRVVRVAVFTGWLNRGLDPRTRATVNSIAGQADAVGQALGGPIIGIVATVRSVTAAIVMAGLVRLPVQGLYARAIRRGTEGALSPGEVADDEVAAAT